METEFLGIIRLKTLQRGFASLAEQTLEVTREFENLRAAGRRVEIITRAKHATGFTVLPRRWVVERSFAWLSRNRRLAKYLETHVEYAAAHLQLAMIKLLTRRPVRA